MKSLIILLVCITSLLTNSQSDYEVDYKPRLLLKELDDRSCREDFELRELKLPDTLAGIYRIYGKFFEVICNEKRISTVYIGRVYCCRAGGCVNQSVKESEADFEYFDYFILFGLHNKISSVRIYNYAATHGQEITAKGWLNQFTGFDGTRSLRVGKEIDSVSGATISVNGLVADVQEKTAILRKTELSYRLQE